MYMYKVLSYLEHKLQIKDDLYSEEQMRILGACLDLILNFGSLTERQLHMNRRIATKIKETLQSKTMIDANDSNSLHVQQGWNMVRDHADKLRGLYGKSNMS